jgi:ribonuclease HII
MRICGFDEAGRGPLAGPVVAAAVVLPDGFTDERIRDSKALSTQQREKLFDYIKESSLAWSIVAVGPRRIEALNILQATKLAMRLAVARVEADLVLVDGNQPIVCTPPQRTVVGGDRLHVQISAASILAKVWRDRLMCQLAKIYPGYGFEKHSGYPTPAHKAALLKLGASRIHRRTFAGVCEVISHAQVIGESASRASTSPQPDYGSSALIGALNSAKLT